MGYRVKYNKLIISITISIGFLYLAGCGSAPVKPSSMPKGVFISKDVKVPIDIHLAIYAPQNLMQSSFFSKYSASRVEPGKALENSILSVSRLFFPKAKMLDLKSTDEYGLLLDLAPEWNFERGKIESVMNFEVSDTSGKSLLKGKMDYRVDMVYDNYTVGFQNAATRTMQLVMAAILNKLRPTLEEFSTLEPVSNIDPMKLIDLETPVSSGTGFFINDSGQLLTAAHVTNHCLVTKIQLEEDILEANIQHSSNLLDVTVLSTNTKPDNYLKVRTKNKIDLGEKVTTVSYPLKGLLAASPNLTIGNVSSKKALTGSLGQFQFSAPIQPGSSGGPVVGEKGDVIGIVTSTLNSKSLVEKGVLSQNINFGLDLEFLTKFLRKHKVRYSKFSKKQQGMTDAEIALASTVQIACYQ
jgi:serine protease Do